MDNIISFSDWQKLDIRIAKILKADDIEGADKLFKLTVKIGDEERNLVAGIKGYYKKEELKGKRIVVLTNLEPKVLRGIESRGMLLAAIDNGKPVLLTTDKDSGDGAKVS